MCVNQMHSFSHEIYREVVYEKYICSRDNLIRWHQLMAVTSSASHGPRKLVACPTAWRWQVRGVSEKLSHRYQYVRVVVDAAVQPTSLRLGRFD